MSTATDERTTVDELVAMLDAEPACAVGITIHQDGSRTLGCEQPARWIAKGHCGHPFVTCDEHHDVASGPIGALGDRCGFLSVWAKGAAMAFVGGLGPRWVTGDPLHWLPL